MDEKNEEIKIQEASNISMQPFFGHDKKYGSCPHCAAVIIVKNEETTSSCPNCKATLVFE